MRVLDILELLLVGGLLGLGVWVILHVRENGYFRLEELLLGH